MTQPTVSSTEGQQLGSLKGVKPRNGEVVSLPLFSHSAAVIEMPKQHRADQLMFNLRQMADGASLQHNPINYDKRKIDVTAGVFSTASEYLSMWCNGHRLHEKFQIQFPRNCVRKKLCY